MHRDQDGFTIVELLMTMTLLVVVLGATLTTFDSFSSGSSANARLTQAQDDARVQLDLMTRSLRNATPVVAGSAALVRTTGNDLIFSSYGDGNGSTASYSRYCVNTTTATLWLAQTATYSDPGSACPGSWPGAGAIVNNVANTATSPLFTVDGSGREVGISLLLNAPDASARARTLSLSSSAFLRSSSGRAPNLSAADVSATCTTVNGSKQALLQLGAGVGGGDPLSASYTVAGVPIGTGAVKLAVDAPVQVAVTITNLLGLKQVLTKTVSC